MVNYKDAIATVITSEVEKVIEKHESKMKMEYYAAVMTTPGASTSTSTSGSGATKTTNTTNTTKTNETAYTAKTTGESNTTRAISNSNVSNPYHSNKLFCDPRKINVTTTNYTAAEFHQEVATRKTPLINNLRKGRDPSPVGKVLSPAMPKEPIVLKEQRVGPGASLCQMVYDMVHEKPPNNCISNPEELMLGLNARPTKRGYAESLFKDIKTRKIASYEMLMHHLGFPHHNQTAEQRATLCPNDHFTYYKGIGYAAI